MTWREDFASMERERAGEPPTRNLTYTNWPVGLDNLALRLFAEYLADWAMMLVKHPAKGMEKDAVEHIDRLWAEAKKKAGG